MIDQLGIHLVISPHLDDAVLSRGALISAWRKLGHRVIVATVLTGGPDRPLSAAAVADANRYGGREPIALRLDEDWAAGALLDFEPIHLGFPELLYRFRSNGTPRCANLEDLFGPPEIGDQDLIDAIAVALTNVMAVERPTWLHVPAGFGRHIDHVVVRAAAERVAAAGDAEFFYYADLPYALDGADGLPRQTVTEVESPWTVDVNDIDRWIAGIARYESQVEIMFTGRNWERKFREWGKTHAGSVWAG